MDRLETMRIFIAVAEQAGFARAARQLALSGPAVTRAVAALEDRVGTRLLHRSTRHVRLTEAGARFLADCKRILAEIADAEASAAGFHAEPRGPLAITAPVLFGRMHIVPILLDFLARYPDVTARAMMVDRIVDLMEEGIDVAVRIAELPDSSLSAVRVGSVRRVVCASPDYIAAHGRPRSPEELANFDAIAFSQASGVQEWTFRAGTRALAMRPRAQLRANNSDVAIAAAVAGRGFTQVLSYQIVPELRAGRLEVVLSEFEPPPVPIHLVHLDGRRAAARVRGFLDFATERLRADGTLAS
jgi:DNA-binding transcriptional LysR family regulator